MASARDLTPPNLSPVRPRSKYDVPSGAPASSPHSRSAVGRSDAYSRHDGADSASQRSVGSYSQHSSQDGAVLGRFPKPAAMFRTPAATPSLEPSLVNTLLRQQADRDETIRRLNDRVLSMEGAIATLKDTNAELLSGTKRREARLYAAHPMPTSAQHESEPEHGRVDCSIPRGVCASALPDHSSACSCGNLWCALHVLSV
jgi:hypothetical protein